MSKPLNVLVIFNDDHGQWALNRYGNPAVRTPALNYLADTGALMANAFAPTPVCSPARACFLTGRLASQHGIHDYLASDLEDVSRKDWLADEQTLPQILKRKDYQTAMIGKWHLGRDAEPQAGFDHWFSLGGDYPIDHGGVHRFSDNGRLQEVAGYKTQIITDQAVDWLSTLDSERPFFVFVGFTATHSPWVGHPQRLVHDYREMVETGVPAGETYPFGRQNLESTLETRNEPREALAEYYAGVSQLDEATGRLLDHLDARGLRENTLVVYTSDHGLCCGHHGIWGKGNGTLPLNMVEESIRIPMILNHPSRLPPAQRREEFVDHLDLFQTLVDFCDARDLLPSGKNYPGRSFAQALTGGATRQEWRQVQFGEYGNVRMIRTETSKLILRYPHGSHELFDLEGDPRETTNLYSDSSYRRRVEELTELLENHFREFEDPAKSGLRVLELPRHNITEAWRVGAEGTRGKGAP